MTFLIEKWVNGHAMPAGLLASFLFLLFFITMYSVANKKIMMKISQVSTVNE